jgi:hypothetical protein
LSPPPGPAAFVTTTPSAPASQFAAAATSATASKGLIRTRSGLTPLRYATRGELASEVGTLTSAYNRLHGFPSMLQVPCKGRVRMLGVMTGWFAASLVFGLGWALSAQLARPTTLAWCSRSSRRITHHRGATANLRRTVRPW